MSTEVLVPPLGTTVDTVTLLSWYKNEGDAIKMGEPLFAIETDKASLDVEAPASGVLRRVTAKAGDEVKALTPIAVIAAAGETLAAPVPAAGRAARGPADEAGQPGAAGGAVVTQPAAPRQRIFISPRARRLAEQQDVPWATLTGTGPEGAISERDVRAYMDRAPAASVTPVARRVAEQAGLDWRTLAGSGPRGQVVREDVDSALAQREGPSPAPVPPAPEAPYEVLPLEGIRAVIAERMLRSATQTAPVTLTSEADASALVKMRRHLAEDGAAVSYNDLFVYILARALREHPRLNASLDETAIRLWRSIHIGLAVDTERGLLVPVVRDVGSKGLLAIAAETPALVERARTGRCTPDELRGGTFTLTNLGSLGIDVFTPIINLPECAILGVGRIKSRPELVGKKVKARHMVWLSLTFDHRLVDGAPAARFLQRVVQLVERPHLLVT